MGHCQCSPCRTRQVTVAEQTALPQEPVPLDGGSRRPPSPLAELEEGLTTPRPPPDLPPELDIEPDEDAARPADVESEEEVLEFAEDEAIVAHLATCSYATKFRGSERGMTPTFSSAPSTPMMGMCRMQAMPLLGAVTEMAEQDMELLRAGDARDTELLREATGALLRGASLESYRDDVCDLFDVGWPEDKYDLRQYLGVGDVLNLHGRNHWGHTLLVLDAPRAILVPQVRDAWGREVLENATVFVVRTLESASNLERIFVTVTLLLVHPETKAVVSAHLADDQTHVVLEPGAGTLPGMRSPICPVDIVLSPLDAGSLDEEVLRLSVDETRFAVRDQAWSLRTGVRALLRNGLLDRSKFQTADRKLRLAEKLEGKWQERPVCSTVPPRVWQKYLLKMSYKRFHASAAEPARSESASAAVPLGQRACEFAGGPRAGRSGEGAGLRHSTAPHPDVAWIEDVLRFMPVKDDRILPAELMSALAQDGEGWSWLDFDQGPPAHRAPPREPPQATHYCRASQERPLPRKALQPLSTNRAGSSVALGDDHFTLYCGLPCAPPRPRRKGEEGGRCGPSAGPQCLACRRAEDRLYR